MFIQGIHYISKLLTKVEKIVRNQISLGNINTHTHIHTHTNTYTHIHIHTYIYYIM